MIVSQPQILVLVAESAVLTKDKEAKEKAPWPPCSLTMLLPSQWMWMWMWMWNVDVDVDTGADEILLAATNHDLESLRKLLRKDSSLAKVQDSDTGFSPLHAAIASCEPDEEEEEDEEDEGNGEGDAISRNALDEEGALATVKLLFENGAIWNELDNAGDTPGCLAHKLGSRKVYEAIVDAGVRAELLFSRMDQYAQLAGGEEEEEEEEGTNDEAIVGFEPSPVEPRHHAPWNRPTGTAANGGEEFEGFEPAPNPSYKIDDESMEGASPPTHTTAPTTNTTQPLTAELHPELHPTATPLTNPNVNNEDYLKSTLTYSGDRLLDSDNNAVMMDWETEIMTRSAALLAPKSGLRTMNVGHGMGIVDRMFLSHEPSMHHIIEAHPAVLTRLKDTGWYEKPNVTVHEGRWQDVLPKLIEDGVVLDGIYYDTYAEDYKDLQGVLFGVCHRTAGCGRGSSGSTMGWARIGRCAMMSTPKWWSLISSMPGWMSSGRILRCRISRAGMSGRG